MQALLIVALLGPVDIDEAIRARHRCMLDAKLEAQRKLTRALARGIRESIDEIKLEIELISWHERGLYGKAGPRRPNPKETTYTAAALIEYERRHRYWASGFRFRERMRKR